MFNRKENDYENIKMEIDCFFTIYFITGGGRMDTAGDFLGASGLCRGTYKKYNSCDGHYTDSGALDPAFCMSLFF